MHFWRMALSCALLATASVASAGDVWPFYFDPTQKKTQIEILRNWKSETVPFYMGGRSVKSCAEFVQASGGSIRSEAITPQAEAVFGSCADLSLLVHAKPPQQLLFSHDSITRDMAEHLDLRSLPWQIQSGGTPSDLSKKQQIKLTLKAAEMTFKGKYRDFGTEKAREYYIQFLASADFDGSGKESVVALYSVSDASGEQGGVEDGTVLLTRNEPNGPIFVKPFVVVAP